MLWSNRLQLVSLNLTADGLREFILEDDDSRILIRCGMGFYVVLDFFL